MDLMNKTHPPKVPCNYLISASDLHTDKEQEAVPNITGFTVQDTTGEVLGKVLDMFVDPATKQPLFAMLEIGGVLGVGSRTIIVPSHYLTYQGNNTVALHSDDTQVPIAEINRAATTPALPTKNPIASYASYLAIGRLLIWTAQTAGPMKVFWKWASKKYPMLKDLHECDFCLGFWILSGMALIQKQDITPQLGFPRIRFLGEIVTGLLSSFLLQVIRIGTTVRFGEVEVVEHDNKEDARPPRERILHPVK